MLFSDLFLGFAVMASNIVFTSPKQSEKICWFNWATPLLLNFSLGEWRNLLLIDTFSWFFQRCYNMAGFRSLYCESWFFFWVNCHYWEWGLQLSNCAPSFACEGTDSIIQDGLYSLFAVSFWDLGRYWAMRQLSISDTKNLVMIDPVEKRYKGDP